MLAQTGGTHSSEEELLALKASLTLLQQMGREGSGKPLSSPAAEASGLPPQVSSVASLHGAYLVVAAGCSSSVSVRCGPRSGAA